MTLFGLQRVRVEPFSNSPRSLIQLTVRSGLILKERGAIGSQPYRLAVILGVRFLPAASLPSLRCWGLDPRESARRLIPPPKTSLCVSAGLRRRETNAPEGRSPSARVPRARELTLGRPKETVDHPEA